MAAMRWMRQTWIEEIAADRGWLCTREEQFIYKVTNPRSNESVRIRITQRNAVLHDFEMLKRTLPMPLSSSYSVLQ